MPTERPEENSRGGRESANLRRWLISINETEVALLSSLSRLRPHSIRPPALPLHSEASWPLVGALSAHVIGSRPFPQRGICPLSATRQVQRNEDETARRSTGHRAASAIRDLLCGRVKPRSLLIKPLEKPLDSMEFQRCWVYCGLCFHCDVPIQIGSWYSRFPVLGKKRRCPVARGVVTRRLGLWLKVC